MTTSSSKIFIDCRSVTLGEGGLFSSSEQEGERALRRLRVGRGVSGGEGEGVGGCDFFSEYSESSISSSCSSEPVSSLRESSSSRSSSSPLPCEARQRHQYTLQTYCNILFDASLHIFNINNRDDNFDAVVVERPNSARVLNLNGNYIYSEQMFQQIVHFTF